MSGKMTQTAHFDNPVWFDGRKINEALFCEEFLRKYPMVTVNGAFFTVNGRVHDENRLKKVIYDRIKSYVTSGIAKKVANLLDVMRMECCTEKLSLYQDRIHVANGTYYLNGTFSPQKDFCRNRLPVSYNPEAPQPVTWLHFLSQLLEPEDILTLQEFMGYCFIPSTKGQKMLLLIGKGGEGKSRIGIVLRALLGSNMNTGSMNLSPAVKKEYKKLYVAYKLDTNFVDIVFQKQRLRISINMKFSEINDPNGICKDITGLGRWGNGDVELFMEHQDELDQIMEIVKQSYAAQAE